MRWPTWAQKRIYFERIGYTPHRQQLPAHKTRARVIVVAGGERSGKSRWAGAEIGARAPWCERVAVGAQEYDEAHKEMEYLARDLDEVGNLAGFSNPKRGKWIIEAKTGLTVETVSLHGGADELTGTGDPFDVVALVEAGLIRYDAFLAARRRVAETRGIVLVIGTLKDNWGWHADLWRKAAGPNVFRAQRFSFPMWSNRAIFPEGEQDPEIQELKRQLPDEEYARTVAADVVPSPARIYPEFTFARDAELGHVRELSFDPEEPVLLWVDPGFYPSHYCVLPVQFRRETVEDHPMEVVHIIDEVYEHHKTHHGVIEICRSRAWWANAERAVGGHETKQHPSSASTQEVWENLVGTQEGDPERFRFDVFDAGRVVDGIVRVHTFLEDPAMKRPRLYVNVGCDGVQEEFGTYKRRTDARGDVVSDEPQDANNDAMDAIRNGLVERYGHVRRRRIDPTAGKRRARVRG